MNQRSNYNGNFKIQLELNKNENALYKKMKQQIFIAYKLRVKKKEKLKVNGLNVHEVGGG